jgi:hypothetical protein
MKLLFSMQITVVLALFAGLAFTQLATAQQPSTPATTYTYKAINAPGASATAAYAINNSDEVVGYIIGGQCAVISDQASCGFTYQNGKYTYVACELEGATDFFDVNNSGEVIGAYSLIGGVNGFIWEGNDSCFGFADPSGLAFTEAWGVNDSGLIAGYYTDSSTEDFQGFEYTESSNTFSTISCPGYPITRAYGINNAGIIVGDVANSSGVYSGMAYVSGKCTVFNYPGATDTYGRGINSKNQITGFFTNSSGTFGFVRTGSTYTEIDYPGSVSTLAYHLNDKGLIAGFYGDAAGATHGFVAIP